MVVAEVFLFDYDKYQNHILPHFSKLVFEGKLDAWIEQLELDYWNAQNKEKPHLKFTSKLAELEFSEVRYKTYLDNNLGLKTEFFSKIPAFQNEIIAALFHYALLRDCFEQGHFVGRLSFTWNLISYCEKRGWLNNPRLHQLLLALRYRGCFMGSWDVGDGIKGWLNPEETWELDECLVHLPLPEYEASLEGIEQFAKLASNGAKEYSHPDFDVDSLLLSFVRTLAKIAFKENKGIIWVHGARTYLFD